MASITLPLAATLASLAPAQQFVQAVGALPGPAVWSEGVCAADVDRDGDLDLLFANGDGFDTAGARRQNVLVINKLVELGTATFVDESVLRFGVRVSNAKMVIAGDVNWRAPIGASLRSVCSRSPSSPRARGSSGS